MRELQGQQQSLFKEGTEEAGLLNGGMKSPAKSLSKKAVLQLDKTDQNNHFSTLEINKRHIKKKKNGDEWIPEKLPNLRQEQQEFIEL